MRAAATGMKTVDDVTKYASFGEYRGVWWKNGFGTEGVVWGVVNMSRAVFGEETISLVIGEDDDGYNDTFDIWIPYIQDIY